MDSACILVDREWRISFVSCCLRILRAQLHTRLKLPDSWQGRRRKHQPDDSDALLWIHVVIVELPTYGYRRGWALLRRHSEAEDLAAVNAKRVYRIMRQHALLLERKPSLPPSKRAHTGKVAVVKSNQRWYSADFEFRCHNGEKTACDVRTGLLCSRSALLGRQHRLVRQ